jgi:MFS family permease
LLSSGLFLNLPRHSTSFSFCASAASCPFRGAVLRDPERQPLQERNGSAHVSGNACLDSQFGDAGQSSGRGIYSAFFLFSATAGQLADKYEHSRIIRLVKLFEIGIAIVGAAGLARGDLTLLFVALFLLGAHSTFFGPVKYAILPQQLSDAELVGGNAPVETGTFVAILTWTILAGVLMSRAGGPTAIVPFVRIAIAVAGYLASRSNPLADWARSWTEAQLEPVDRDVARD